jgi:hypothetical protein
LEFLITSKDITGCGASSTLLIFNNERGFSATNIESICRVGKSTKKGNRHRGYIGEKGKYSLFFSFIVFPSSPFKKISSSMEKKVMTYLRNFQANDSSKSSENIFNFE